MAQREGQPGGQLQSEGQRHFLEQQLDAEGHAAAEVGLAVAAIGEEPGAAGSGEGPDERPYAHVDVDVELPVPLDAAQAPEPVHAEAESGPVREGDIEIDGVRAAQVALEGEAEGIAQREPDGPAGGALDLLELAAQRDLRLARERAAADEEGEKSGFQRAVASPLRSASRWALSFFILRRISSRLSALR